MSKFSPPVDITLVPVNVLSSIEALHILFRDSNDVYFNRVLPADINPSNKPPVQREDINMATSNKGYIYRPEVDVAVEATASPDDKPMVTLDNFAILTPNDAAHVFAGATSIAEVTSRYTDLIVHNGLPSNNSNSMNEQVGRLSTVNTPDTLAARDKSLYLVLEAMITHNNSIKCRLPKPSYKMGVLTLVTELLSLVTSENKSEIRTTLAIELDLDSLAMTCDSEGFAALEMIYNKTTNYPSKESKLIATIALEVARARQNEDYQFVEMVLSAIEAGVKD